MRKATPQSNPNDRVRRLVGRSAKSALLLMVQLNHAGWLHKGQFAATLVRRYFWRS